MALVVTKINADSDSLNSALADILRLSQQMVCAARDKQWDAVVVFENERVPQLTLLTAALDAVEKTPGIIDFYRQTIVAVIDSDQEVERLAESQKRGIVQETSDLGSSRKAVNAYLNNVAP